MKFASKFVKIDFNGSCTIDVAGTINVPKEIWDDKDDCDLWGVRADEYIKEQISPRNHDTCAEYDIDLCDVFVAKPDDS